MALPLSPPRGEDPTLWALRYDGEPTVAPAWPDHDEAVVVVRIAERVRGGGVAIVEIVTSKAELMRVAHPEHQDVSLFFRIPKAVILAKGLSPGFTENSIEKEELDAP